MRLALQGQPDEFKKIPGSPIAYWISPSVVTSYFRAVHLIGVRSA